VAVCRLFADRMADVAAALIDIDAEKAAEKIVIDALRVCCPSSLSPTVK